jgi:adenylate kinase
MGLCDCGHALSQREDDQEDAIKTRLEVYHRQTEPVIQYYRDRSLLIKVEARGGIEDVRDEIIRRLADLCGNVAAA